MQDSQIGESRFLFDEFTEGTWFRVKVLTDDELISAVLDKSRRQFVMTALGKGAQPLRTLKDSTFLGLAPQIVSLKSVRSLEWHDDDNEFFVEYVDPANDRLRCLLTVFSTPDARARFVDEIKLTLGTWEERSQPASIWRVGSTQLVVSTFAILICGGLAIAGWVAPNLVNRNILRGPRNRALLALFNAVGPAGMVVIGFLITTAMMVWWYLACRNPPLKTTVKRL